MAHPALLLAASLSLIIGAVHSWLGERLLIGPLLHANQRAGMLKKSSFARQVLRFGWHITTIAWWGMGAILAVLALETLTATDNTVLAIISATYALTGVAILLWSRGRHLAWLAFFAMAVLALTPRL